MMGQPKEEAPEKESRGMGQPKAERSASALKTLKDGKVDPASIALSAFGSAAPGTMQAIQKAQKIAKYWELLSGLVACCPALLILFAAGALIGIAQGIINDTLLGQTISWFASWVSDGFGEIVKAVRSST